MRVLRSLLGLGVAAVLGACGSNSSGSAPTACPSPRPVSIKVVDNAFKPDVHCVEPGTKVTWTFTGNQVHDIAGEGFKSDLRRDGTFSHKFVSSGVYEYRCTIHGGMNGEVRVGRG